MANKKPTMKSLVLRDDVELEEGIPNYKSLCLTVLKAPLNPQAGADYEEMATVAPIITKIKEAELGDEVLLTDGEFSHLKKRARKYKFGVNSNDILDWVKHVESCPDVGVKKEED